MQPDVQQDNRHEPVPPPIPVSGSAAPPANPPSSPNRSKGQLVGCLLVIAVLVGIGLVGLVAVLALPSAGLGGLWGSPPTQPPPVEEYLEREGQGKRKVVIVDVKGVLQPTTILSEHSASTVSLIRQLRMIEQDKNVAAVVLDMNTPGGEVTATDEVHHALLRLRQRRGLPIVTCMRALAASGGYYLAAGTDYIIANRMTITGSIGVILGGYNYGGLLDKLGVHAEFYTSGKFKDALSMARERRPEEVALLQTLVRNSFDHFAEIVAAGRPVSPEQVAAMEAAIFTGSQAVENGLVDELGYLDDAIDKAAELAGLSHPPVVRYSPRPSLSQVLFGLLGAPDSLRRVAPPGLKLQPGVPYYLYPLAL